MSAGPFQALCRSASGRECRRARRFPLAHAPAKSQHPIRREAAPLLKVAQPGCRPEPHVVHEPSDRTADVAGIHEFAHRLARQEVHYALLKGVPVPEQPACKRDLAAVPKVEIGDQLSLCVADPESVGRARKVSA